MDIQISDQWSPFIREQLESGRFESADDVLENALDLLKRSLEQKQAETLEGIRRD